MKNICKSVISISYLRCIFNHTNINDAMVLGVPGFIYTGRGQ